MKSVTKAIRLPECLVSEIEALAKKDDRNFSQLVRIMLRSSLSNYYVDNSKKTA